MNKMKKECSECHHEAGEHGPDGCYHIEYDSTGVFLVECSCNLTYDEVINQEGT